VVTESGTDQTALSHRREKVEIALDQRRLRDERNGVVRLATHFQDAACDAMFALDRLVGIGVDTDGQRLALVAGLREGFPQQLRRIDLRKQSRLEIDAR